MAITQDAGRQCPLVADVNFTYADLTDATAEPAVKLPAGAVVIGGQLVITTVFNSAVSDTIAVGGPAALLAATDVTALGTTVFTGGAVLTAADTVDLTWDGTGAVPTTGAGYLIVNYIIDDRATEVNP